MELHDDTAFDTGTDAATTDFAAVHDGGIADPSDGGLSGGDDHYSMIANTGGDDPTGDHSNYGDNSPAAGTDSSSASGSTVSIQVDGHTYTEAATIDSSGNAEAHISLPDGDSVIAIDTDHDGEANEAGILDSSGKVIDVQHEDTSSGQWIDDGVPGGSSSGSDSTSTDSTDSTDTTGSDTTGTDGYPSSSSSSDSSGDSSTSTDSTDSTDGTDSSDGGAGAGGAAAGTTAAGGSGQISVEVGGHEYTATETIDVNHDGRADSGVVEADGKTYLLTDFDGDGHADHIEVGKEGEWTGGYSVSPDGNFTPDPGTTPDESDIPSGSSYAVDPQTGEWVSGN